jgi:uncharacterized protein
LVRLFFTLLVGLAENKYCNNGANCIMDIEKLVANIEEIFASIEADTRVFLEKAAVKCPPGCYQCCTGKNITACPLEFIPYAWDLKKRGVLEERYWDFKNGDKSFCYLLKTNEEGTYGMCGEYPLRGVVCRLFGSAAMMGKEGVKKYIGCKILKEQVQTVTDFQDIVQAESPVFANYYMAMKAVDIHYGSILLPVREAILHAMEMVYNNTREEQ